MSDVGHRTTPGTPFEWPLDDLLEWATTCRYFGSDDFEKLTALANRTSSLRDYIHRLGGWLHDDPAPNEATLVNPVDE